jgi:hypothetical protein|tara:strand:- start:162 stop:335 length:174 start_codon:yes stop_codon:yes gene_type:complete
MEDRNPIFAELRSADEKLAAEVALCLGCELPAECVAGVAINARLLQQHVDILRRPAR